MVSYRSDKKSDHGSSVRKRMTVLARWKPNPRRIQVTPPVQETRPLNISSAVPEFYLNSFSFPKLYISSFPGPRSLSIPEIHKEEGLYTVGGPFMKPFLGENMVITKDNFSTETFQTSQIMGSRSHPDSFFARMRPLLYLFQAFALLPVCGLSGRNNEQIRFRWLHWKMLYVAITVLGVSFLFICSWILSMRYGFSYDRSAPMVFYASGVTSILLFVNLARQWADLSRHFAQVEQVLAEYGHPRALGRKFLRILLSFSTFAIVEHGLSKFVVAMKAIPCHDDENDAFYTFLLNEHYQVFSLIDYNLFLGILTVFFNFSATVCWNFTDLFLGLMAMSLSSFLRQLNQELASIHGQEKPSSYWRKVREQFNEISVLTKIVDQRIQKIMLLSLGNNLFFICLQLLRSLKKRINTYQIIYFFCSFGFLILRTCFVTLCAAGVFDESRESKTVLYSVPQESFSQEVRRFLTQLSTDELVLTGCRFFSVTRGLVLTIAGTVVTYEIVLVQFKTDIGVEDWPTEGNKTGCATIPQG